MNYTAVNTKIKALRAKLLTANDYSQLVMARQGGGGTTRLSLKDDFTRIAPYLYDKNVRDFVARLEFAAPHRGQASRSVMHGFASLDKSSRVSLLRVFGVETDLRNILGIYRLKRFHKIDGDAIFSFLIPYDYRLSVNEVAAMAYAKDFDIFINIVAGGSYGDVFAKLSDFERGEQAITKAVRTQFEKERRFENLAVVCGYLYARYLEIKNIQAIAGALHQGFAPDEILSLLH
ncbi:MAG: V-type ATPase subunit [Defluviitaleaceae bacterium]|nr:V-type ATPase subunit [Defluviitaleaceae bacterium]